MVVSGNKKMQGFYCVNFIGYKHVTISYKQLLQVKSITILQSMPYNNW